MESTEFTWVLPDATDFHMSLAGMNSSILSELNMPSMEIPRCAQHCSQHSLEFHNLGTDRSGTE